MERLCRRPFRSMADYALARASAAAKLTAELHAQARQNGRVLDDFVFRIGGSETLKVEADLDKFIPRPEFKGWKVFFETLPHDLTSGPGSQVPLFSNTTSKEKHL